MRNVAGNIVKQNVMSATVEWGDLEKLIYELVRSKFPPLPPGGMPPKHEIKIRQLKKGSIGLENPINEWEADVIITENLT